MAAALARFSSFSASSRPITSTRNGILGRGCVSFLQSSLKRSLPSPPCLWRAFASHGNNEERRNKPRIHLSRRQIRRLWEALGESNEKEGGGGSVDRIPVDPKQFPMELFEDDAASLSFSLQGRISIDPSDFPLELFEDSKATISHDRFERRHGGDEQALEQGVAEDPTSQVAAWEEEMRWYLKRARRDAEPHRFVEKAQSILKRWHEEAQKSSNYPSPSWKAHEHILRGWNRIGLEAYDPHAANQADQVLQQLLKHMDENKLEIQGPLHFLFTWVIRLWLRAPQSHKRDQRSPTEHLRVAESLLASATRASELLLDLERRSDVLNDESFCKQPDNAAYIAILNAFNSASKATNMVGAPPRGTKETDGKDIYSDSVNIAETSAQRAEDVLMRMEKRAQAPGALLSPPLFPIYRAVLSTWANANTRQGIVRAHDILQRMEEAPHLQHIVDIVSYRRMLRACARISHLYQYDAEDSEAPANLALSLLIRMDPELLPRLRGTGNVFLWIGDEGDQDSYRPREPIGDVQCYVTVIQAIAQADVGIESTLLEVTPALLAEAVLDRTEELHSAGKLDTTPNSYCYGNIIRAHSLWADRLADKSSLVSRVERAVKRLEDHIVRGDQVSTTTDKVTGWFNRALRIVAATSFGGSPSRANEILERMEELYVSTGWSRERTVIRPNESSYCIILSALEASTGGLRAAQDAVNVLHRMRTLYERQQELKYGAGGRNAFLCRPSTIAYTIVLRTCASVAADAEEADKQEAFRLASQIFDELQTCLYTSSNSASYASIIQAHANLLPAGDERDEGISKVFQLCRDEGKLDELVMKVMRKACSEDVAAALLDSSQSES